VIFSLNHQSLTCSELEKSKTAFAGAYKINYGRDPPEKYLNLINHLNHSQLARFLKDPADQLHSFIAQLDRTLQTATKDMILKSTGYMVDGLIATGGQASVYFCIHGSQVCCAKIANTQIIEKEVKISNALKNEGWCLCVIAISDSIENIETHAGKSIAILPLIPFVFSNLPMDGDLHGLEALLARSTVCILSAIYAFQRVGYVHNDIKLGNVGYVNSNPPYAVLFDYGSACKLGEAAESTTPIGIEVAPSTTFYDVACLAYLLALSLGVPLHGDVSTAIVTAKKYSGFCADIVPLLLCSGDEHGHVDVLGLAEKVRSLLDAKWSASISDFSALFPSPQ
jgi:hypothetical protein